MNGDTQMNGRAAHFFYRMHEDDLRAGKQVTFKIDARMAGYIPDLEKFLGLWVKVYDNGMIRLELAERCRFHNCLNDAVLPPVLKGPGCPPLVFCEQYQGVTA